MGTGFSVLCVVVSWANQKLCMWGFLQRFFYRFFLLLFGRTENRRDKIVSFFFLL